jgi:hypothetical protein
VALRPTLSVWFAFIGRSGGTIEQALGQGGQAAPAGAERGGSEAFVKGWRELTEPPFFPLCAPVVSSCLRVVKKWRHTPGQNL